MIRALTQTVRGMGLSPTWCYTFLSYKMLLKEFILYDLKSIKHMRNNLASNIIITVVGVSMAEGPEFGVNHLSFIKVLFILEMETCFISGILLARASTL